MPASTSTPPAIRANTLSGRPAVFCAAICLLLAAVSCGAAIRVTGDSPHAYIWQRVYDRMPAVWKTDREVVVREVSDEEMERIVEAAGDSDDSGDSIVDGCYRGGGDSEDEPPTITVRASLRTDKAEQVFTHEYGHYVWDEKLGRSERARYRRVWSADRHAGRLVTRYAAETVEEGFAETYSYFLLRPGALQKRDQAGFQFLTAALDAAKRAEADATER